jgi:two-component system sensor histidine kinase EvgS
MKTRQSMREVDFDELHQRLGGDDALIEDLCRLFLGECPKQMQALESAVERCDLEAVRSAAHHFRGGAAALSAGRAANRVGALEDAAAEGRAPDVAPLMAALRADVDRLVAELRDLLEGEHGANPDRR